MSPDAPDRATRQIAGIAIVIGGVGAIVVNVLHPRPPEQTDDLLRLVATMPHWTTIHYAAAFAAASIVAGFAVLVRTLRGSTARALGEFGKYVITLGAAAFVVAITIDGYGYPRFARLWMAAAEGDKPAILWAATAVHTVDAALFPVWAGTFLGLGIVLVAAGLWLSGEYSRSFAVFGIIGGAMGFIYAMSVAFAIAVPLPLWPLGPAITGLWITALGAIVLTRARKSHAYSPSGASVRS
jgi:hypothetical protein